MNPMKPLPLCSKRNYGIDLLRIVAAIYIIVLHILIQGCLNDAVAVSSSQFYICRFLTASAFCAVNIFGIISGYVGYRESTEKYNLASYLTLWLEVVFYGVIITLYYNWKMPNEVPASAVLSMFFPVSNNLYWYFTAYTALFFIAPLINNGISHSGKQVLIPLLLIILFIFAPFETVAKCFFTNTGFSFLWLVILYLVGALIKKYEIGQNIRPITAFLGIVVLSVISFLLNCKIPSMDRFDESVFCSYTFPLYLYSAILHLILFSKLKPGTLTRKIISFAAPASFAVYIINVQKFFWIHFMSGRFAHWAAHSPINILIRVTAYAVLFVSAVVLIDTFRQKLFKLLRIGVLLNRLTGSIQKAITH